MKSTPMFFMCIFITLNSSSFTVDKVNFKKCLYTGYGKMELILYRALFSLAVLQSLLMFPIIFDVITIIIIVLTQQ